MHDHSTDSLKEESLHFKEVLLNVSVVTRLTPVGQIGAARPILVSYYTAVTKDTAFKLQ